MTVVSTNSYDGPFFGNGTTTVWPFTFQAASAEEVGVLLNDRPLASTGFSVTMQSDDTGSVVITPALPLGSVLFLFSQPKFSQESDFQRYGPYFPDELNLPLDRAAKRDIFLRDELLRSVKVPFGAAVETITDASNGFLSVEAGNIVVGPGTPPFLDFATNALPTADVVDFGFGALDDADVVDFGD